MRTTPMKNLSLLLLLISPSAFAGNFDVCGKITAVTAYTAGMNQGSGVTVKMRNEKSPEKIEDVSLAMDPTLFGAAETTAAYQIAIAAYANDKHICIYRFQSKSSGQLLVHTIGLSD